MLIHLVVPGDTVSGIAAFYGITPAKLIEDNQLLTPNHLVPGQNLLILFPALTHTVQPGDTLFAISRQYGVSLITLYRNNYFLGGKPGIFPGQVLTIAYAQTKLGRLMVNGYAMPNINQDLYLATLPYLTTVSIFAHSFTAEGNLIEIDDRDMIARARTMGVASIMVLAPFDSDQGFDNQLISDVVNSPAASKRLIENVVAAVTRKGYSGVDLDFEYIKKTDAAPYLAFVAALYEALSAQGYTLNIDLAPKTSTDQPGLLYEGQNYAALGKITDTVLVMTYEWGYTYGPPMAVAPIGEVRKSLDYAVSQIPPQKILMGIPNYGYDWTLPFVQGQSKAQSISNPRGVDLAVNHGQPILFRDSAASPYFNYRADSGADHEVWFEDPQSISAKLDVARQLGLRGAGYWSLMRPFPQNWQMLNVLFEIERKDVSIFRPR
ncbi:MAG: glycosyl hydrolase family 18 protein [Clostridiales bacterium]